MRGPVEIGEEAIGSLLTDLQSIPGAVDAITTHFAGWWAVSDFRKMRKEQGAGDEAKGSDHALAGSIKFAVAGTPNALIRGDWINLLSQAPFLMGAYAEYLEHHPEALAEHPNARSRLIKAGSLTSVLSVSAGTGALSVLANSQTGEFQEHVSRSVAKILAFALSQSGYALRESKNGLAKGFAHTFGNAAVAGISGLEIAQAIQEGDPINHGSLFWFLSSGLNAYNSLEGFWAEVKRLRGQN